MKMKDILEVLSGIAIPLAAFVISYIAYRRSVIQTVVEFYAHCNSTEHKKYRKILYNAVNKAKGNLTYVNYTVLDKDGDLAQIVSFYDEWATLVESRYLPLKTFKGITGITAIRAFYMLKPYIDIRREEKTQVGKLQFDNQSYAKSFENLVGKIEHKYFSKEKTVL